MRVGTQDILIPTMMVGNYPKPRWYVGQGFANVPLGNFIGDSVSFEAFEDCVAALVLEQELVGLDVISDARVLGGDSPYANIVYYFTERLKGYSPFGPQLALPQYSTLYSPTVDGGVSRRCPMLIKQLRAVKKVTNKPIKMQYPGLAAFKEISAAGADIIQMDEFAWHYGLSLGEWEIDVFNAAVSGVDAQVIAHVCWGNFMGTKGYLPSGPMHGDNPEREGDIYVLALRDQEGRTARARACFPRAQKSNMDMLNYEIANTGVAELAPLTTANWDRDFVAGVIDVRKTEIEPATEVADLIRACLEVVPAERLGVTTDCGLINLPRQVANGKLRALVEGTKIVRAEILAARAAEAAPRAEVTV